MISFQVKSIPFMIEIFGLGYCLFLVGKLVEYNCFRRSVNSCVKWIVSLPVLVMMIRQFLTKITVCKYLTSLVLVGQNILTLNTSH